MDAMQCPLGSEMALLPADWRTGREVQVVNRLRILYNQRLRAKYRYVLPVCRARALGTLH